MNTRQSAALERKKFFADPVMVVTIAVLTLLLALFILYPLAMLLMDSVHVRETNLITLESVLSGTADVDYADVSGQKSIAVLSNKNKEETIALEALDTAYGYLFAKNGRVLKEGDVIDPANAYVKVNSDYWTLDAFPRIFADYTFNTAFFYTLKLGMITSFGAVVIGLCQRAFPRRQKDV